MRKAVWVSCVAVIGVLEGASAEPIVYYEPHSGYTEVFDSADPGRFATRTPHSFVTGSTRGGNLNFAISYGDVAANNGIGFDDPAEGATRRATLDAVLLHVSDTLNENTGATLDIDVQVSQTDGSGFLATAGTFFSLSSQFSNGAAFEHIRTGTDPFGGSADIFMTVDFGFNWNSDLSNPAGGEVDLFTVLLHEVTHGLGFANLSDENGESVISMSNPGAYGVVAQLTRRSNGTVLWNTTGGASFVGAPSDLVSNDLAWFGPEATSIFGSNPPMFAPPSFAAGSSLSHWDSSLIGTAVMPPAIPSGVTIRDYAEFELGALRDMGYSNVGPGPPPDSDGDGLSDEEEAILGTDPNKSDTDGDGFGDMVERDLGTDPLDPGDFPTGLPVGRIVTLTLALTLACVGTILVYRRRLVDARQA